MKAVETNFLKFIQNRKQFIIPIYQRTYSWTIEQCEQLWNDIVRVAKNDDYPAHFVGSIVYIEKGLYQISQISQLLVIDGQQRITTLTILLCAINKYLGEHPDISQELLPSKITNYYLINPEENDDLRYKILLTQTDRETLKQIIGGNEIEYNSQSIRLVENYKFFKRMIDKQSINIQRLFKGIQKLLIVDISLDRNYDNPQLIFESLNSTGLELSQADLIRNFILMELEPETQTYLYSTYWFPMEQDFGQAGYSYWFDNFMRDYLTLKSPAGAIPRIDEVYKSFKRYKTAQSNQNIENIVKDIFIYSSYYTRFVLDKESDPEIKKILHNMLGLRINVVYPFLLELFHDYSCNILTKEDLFELLTLIESYVFRRAICGIPTNSLNKTFATFAKGIDKSNYLKNIKFKFASLDSYRRFPSNEEFKQEFIIRDVYNLRSRNYLLDKLENYSRKELVAIDEYTIEHILPQNEKLSIQWQKDLGEDWKLIQSKYLHTIGNLTLTGYNPELSDRSFLEKRDIKGGFADSPIRLNNMLRKKNGWSEQAIIDRALILADLAVNIWPYLEVNEEELLKYKNKDLERDNKQYTLDIYSENLQGTNLEIFKQLQKRILNIDSSIKEEIKKIYIAYKTTTNFVDIEPFKNKLIIFLNLTINEINDPRGLCRDISTVGHHGNGDVKVEINNLEDIDYIMYLIEQSYQKYSENE